jgi:hypothetical protein
MGGSRLITRMVPKNKFKTWVNAEVAKQLDKEPFSSLPLKMRVGILILLGCFVVGHGSMLLLVIVPGFNHHLSTGSAVHGSLLYIICWWLGAVGLALAGKDSIKYPIYFFAKFVKMLFSNYFNKED